MSGSKFALGACHKSMGRTSTVKKGEASAAPLAGAPWSMSARNSPIDEALAFCP
jgi:hypothetical protein